jgi:hypothetical protein
MTKYLPQHRIDVAQHVVIPEAQHPISGAHQKACPARIRVDGQGVLSAIELDDEPTIMTDEIHNEGRKWMLAPEFEATEPTVPDTLP